MTKTVALAALALVVAGCANDATTTAAPTTSGDTTGTTTSQSSAPTGGTTDPSSPAATTTAPTSPGTATSGPATTPPATATSTAPAKNEPPFPLPDNAKGDDAQLWAAIDKVLPDTSNKDEAYLTATVGRQVCETFKVEPSFDGVVERFSAHYNASDGMSKKRADAVWLVVAGSRHSCPEHAQAWATAQGFELAPDAKPAPATRPPRVWPKITIPNAWPTKPMPPEQFTTLMNDIYAYTPEESWSYKMYQNLAALKCDRLGIHQGRTAKLASIFTEDINDTIDLDTQLNPTDTPLERTRAGYGSGLLTLQFCPNLATTGYLPESPHSVK